MRDANPRDVLDDIVARSLNQMLRFMRFDGAVFFSFAADFNILWPLATSGDMHEAVPPAVPGMGLVGRAADSPLPCIAERAEITSLGEAWLRAEKARTVVAFPLGSGKNPGVLLLFSRRVVHVDQEMIHGVTAFASQLDSALHRTPLFATADIQHRQIEAITRIIAAAASDKISNEDDLYETMAREARLLTGAHAAIFSRGDRFYSFGQSHRGKGSLRGRHRCVSPSKTLAARMNRTVLRASHSSPGFTFALVWHRRFVPTEQQRQLVELIGNAVSAVEGLRARLMMAERERLAQYLADVSRALSVSLDFLIVFDQMQNLFVPAVADCIAIYAANAISDEEVDPPPIFGKCPDRLCEVVAANWDATRVAPLFVRERFDPPLEGDIAEAILVPMLNGDRCIGTIGFGRAVERGPAGRAEFALYEELASYAAIGIENATSYRRERHIADILQHALLPKILPTHPLALFGADYSPAGTEALVGGDWYDVFPLDEDRFAVSIGDVGGHGLRAARTMNVVRLALRVAGLTEPDPLRVLAQAETVLALEDDPVLVTAIYGIVDVRRATFTYASAGHQRPLLVQRDGSILSLPTYGIPLATGLFAERKRFETPFVPGDILVLYTDGLVEYERNVLAGEQRLQELLKTLVQRGSLATLASDLRKMTFEDGYTQHDDIAVLTIALRPQTEPEAAGQAAQPSAIPVLTDMLAGATAALR